MKKLFFYLSFWCLFFFTASADEGGMWMLHSLKQQKLNDMKELGLKLEDYDIYNPPDGSSIKDAVVQFGGGCTGGGYLLTGGLC